MEKPAWLATKKGAEVASFAARQHLSLSLSLTLIAFVRAMPTQQSKCDVQYQPDSEVVLRPLKIDQASLGSCE